MQCSHPSCFTPDFDADVPPQCGICSYYIDPKKKNVFRIWGHYSDQENVFTGVCNKCWRTHNLQNTPQVVQTKNERTFHVIGSRRTKDVNCHRCNYRLKESQARKRNIEMDDRRPRKWVFFCSPNCYYSYTFNARDMGMSDYWLDESKYASLFKNR